MKRTLLWSVTIVAGLVLLSGMALAQMTLPSGSRGDSTILVAVQQGAPVLARVAVPMENGSTVELTVPLTIGVDLQVSLEPSALVESIQEARGLPQIQERYTLSDALTALPTLSDMPDGFEVQTEAEPLLPDEELAEQSSEDPEATLANLEQWGIEGGYFNEFIFSGLPLFGTGRLRTTILIYGDAEGARAHLEAWDRREARKVEDGEYISRAPLSSSPVGDRTLAYKANSRRADESRESEWEYSVYTLAFQQGNALVFVDTISFRDAGDFRDNLRIGRKVSRKLREAARQPGNEP